MNGLWGDREEAVWKHETQHNTTQYNTLHYSLLHHTTPQSTPPHHTTLHYTTLHYTTLHYTTLHYTTPYHAALTCGKSCFSASSKATSHLLRSTLQSTAALGLLHLKWQSTASSCIPTIWQYGRGERREKERRRSDKGVNEECKKKGWYRAGEWWEVVVRGKN